MDKVKLLLLFFGVMASFILPAQSNQFSKEAVLADLAFLKQELVAHHPNLYTYSTPEAIDNWFDQQAINTPLLLDKHAAFKAVASISSVLKDGHSYIYPSAQYLDSFFNGALLFPLAVFLQQDSLVVVANHSNEQNIPLGARLVAINGKTITEMQTEIIPRISRDGENLAYPRHLFYQFFPAYYSSFYGFTPQFDLSFLDQVGTLKKVTIKGITRNEMKTKRHSTALQGITLQLLNNQKAAILTIKSFDNQRLKKNYQQKFKKEIKQAFKIIQAQGIQHLAIDLRDNQGGELRNGIYLLQHFMQAAFQCVNNYVVLKNGKKRTLNTKWDNYFEPKHKNHFQGTVYLFTNGGSFSCSAIVANAFKTHKRGTILGEMTGGSAFVNAGGPNKRLTLPNTNILFTIPKTQYNLRANTGAIGLGVRPDIQVTAHSSRLLDGSDNFIQTFMALINE